MDENRTILGILSSAVGEYLSMRTDDFKKNIVTSLSVGFSRVLAVLVIILLLLIVLGVFAFRIGIRLDCIMYVEVFILAYFLLDSIECISKHLHIVIIERCFEFSEFFYRECSFNHRINHY